MRPEDKNRIDKLEAQVKQLMAFMQEKQKTQITFPLDYPSQQIIQNGVPIVTGAVVNTPAANTGYLPVKVDNKILKLMLRA